MRTPSRLLAAAVLAAGTAVTVPASAIAAPTPFAFAAYGDAPYGTTPTDDAQFKATPAFIDSINAAPAVRFVIHVGDIHSGRQYCTQAYDESIAGLWAAYTKPLVY